MSNIESFGRIQKRRHLLKSKLKMNLRKKFNICFQEYLKNVSTVGIKKINSPAINMKERIFWIVLTCILIGVTGYYLKYIWFDTLSNPLIVSIDSSTYHISNINFPAIAICNVNRISKQAVKKYAKAIYPTLTKANVSVHDIEWLTVQLGRLLDFSFNDDIRNHPLLDKIYFNMDTLIEWMQKLSPDCEKILVRCLWNGVVVDCKSIFDVRRTVRGHCCTFNYVLDFDTPGKPNRISSNVKRQNERGTINGLNIILDAMLDDYAHPIHNVKGFEILIFEPTQYPDPNSGIVLEHFAEPNKAVSLELKSIKQIATSEVRKYSPATRKCLFRDEKPVEFGEMYSYSACIVDCRLKTIQSLCGCTPFYFPTAKYEKPVCTFENLRCLNKYKEKFIYVYPVDVDDSDTTGLEMEIQDSLYCPNCLPDCEFTAHIVKTIKRPITLEGLVYPKGKEYKDYFSNGFNVTNKCFLSIYQPTADATLNRLDVIFYWYELLSNIGGEASMLLGFSLISVIEYFYFFIFRYFQLL